MKKTLFSVLLLLSVAIFSVLASDSPVAEKSGCPCTGAAYTVIACYPKICGVLKENIPVELFDEDCKEVVSSCTITPDNLCCTFPQQACGDHQFHVKYTIGGNQCSTSTFSLTTNPQTVYIGCSCP